MNDQCDHEKVYEDSMMMSYPPKQNWISKKCGAIGVTVIGIPSKNKATFEEIKRMFESQ
ncbi:hypothetical protein KAF80_01465 [Bacillus sp. WL1]|uniref:hypothetical protein n=1 Tax=Bacillus sp. WL1 TaxID=2822693 RepID=UPI001B321DB4|nr:hypothetical protein [Bacillus sp. WL1]MBP3967714.1 hypothetical protein [Bacillus sp. WL1]